MPAALAALIALAAIGPATAGAADFQVTVLSDAVDEDPGDGVCSIEGGGCALRAAVQESNALSGADSIELPSGSTSELGLSLEGDDFVLGVLRVTGDLTVKGAPGARAAVSAGDAYSIFWAADGSDLTLDHLRLEQAVHALSVSATLPSTASAMVTDSVLTDNHNPVSGGGAIFSRGSLIVRNSKLAGNTALWGAAVYAAGGSLTIDRTLIAANSSTSATARGAVDLSYDLETPPAATITNSTFSGNTGALASGVNVGFGSAAIAHSTFAGGSGGPSVSVDEGLQAGSPGSIDLVSSIVLDGPAAACRVTAGGTLSGSGNVIGDETCAGLAAGAEAKNLTGAADATIALGPLAENGGPFETLAISPASAAVDRGAADCSPPLSADLDARGVLRPQETACDAGAVETDADGAPQTTIGSGPADDARLGWGPVAFGFNASQAATFECRFRELGDPAPAFAACTSPFAATPGSDGEYRFEVRAIDALGQKDPTPAVRDLAWDTTPPDIGVTGPSGRIADPTPTYTLTGPDDIDSFRCAIDGGAELGCPAVFTTGPLADGVHALSFGAIDQTGYADPDPEHREIHVDTVVGAAITAVEARVGADGRVAIRVACEPDESEPGCDVVDGRIVSARKLRTRPGGPKRRLVVAKLGSGSVVEPGTTATVKAPVTAAVRSRLRQIGPLGVETSLRVRDELGNITTLRLGSKLRA